MGGTQVAGSPSLTDNDACTRGRLGKPLGVECVELLVKVV